MFTFPVCHFSSKIAPVKVFINNSNTINSGTSRSFTATDFGGVEPSLTRTVVVLIAVRNNAPVATCTIAGISATLYGAASGTNNVDKVAIAVAVVPTGTGSFNVTYTTSGSYIGTSASVYVLDGLKSSTPFASGGNAGRSVTIPTVPDNSFVFVNISTKAGLTDFSGTLGITTRDGGVQYYPDRRHAWASIDKTTGGSSLTCTYNAASAGDEAIDYIVFEHN